ncbi:helical backbone metal receptor [Nocardioides sp. zg-1228]|uniref:helical backbone metal receptor n=1 Tax=Nocardioides sp. zg-1228 TaxID=2763008 RepID=UPI001642EFA1|nr:helical backbone metal receptor [Nocardioides sp. zg-1228]MBC2932576.1 cobalamin-binding protein [Nocardioides sp. zg-1228]QSF58073.1 cobalamin-binding protein [Nocardioides sp. zg-1228]
MRDDLGADVPLQAPATRIVSLVPSLTEAIAATAPDRLVGATDWCTHPADLAVARVRGTKNPDLAAVRALSPDLVVANMEENRELDVRRLRDAGVAVWVTRIETVAQSLESMSRLLATALDVPDPDWLVAARTLWGTPSPRRLSVAVPIWRDPWMVVGSPTYTDDLLATAGLVNVLADRDGRYPTVTPDEIDRAGADLVLLPDEPYVFTADDGPEALRTPTRLLSGRLLTWYGPAMVEAHAALANLQT